MIRCQKRRPEAGAQRAFPAYCCFTRALFSATDFVRGAIIATITPENKPALASLREGDKFDWIIPPPETFKKAADDKRDPSAPTLRAPHHQ